MQVVHYEEAEQWFLLEEDGRLYMDVRCSSGFTDFSRLFALNEAERTDYEQEGMPSLNRVAERGRDAASQEFTERNLPRFWHDKAYDAIIAWRTANGTLALTPPTEVIRLDDILKRSN